MRGHNASHGPGAPLGWGRGRRPHSISRCAGGQAHAGSTWLLWQLESLSERSSCPRADHRIYRGILLLYDLIMIAAAALACLHAAPLGPARWRRPGTRVVASSSSVIGGRRAAAAEDRDGGGVVVFLLLLRRSSAAAGGVGMSGRRASFRRAAAALLLLIMMRAWRMERTAALLYVWTTTTLAIAAACWAACYDLPQQQLSVLLSASI